MSISINTEGSFSYSLAPYFSKPENLRAYYLLGGSIEESEKNRALNYNDPLNIETPRIISDYSINFGLAGYGTTEISYQGGSYTMLVAFKSQAGSGSGALVSLMNLPKTDHPNRERLYMMQEQVTVWHNGSRLGFLGETNGLSTGEIRTVVAMSYNEPENTITTKLTVNGGNIVTYTYTNLAANVVDPNSVFMIAYPDEGDGEGNWYLSCYWDSALNSAEAESAITTARRIVNSRDGGF